MPTGGQTLPGLCRRGKEEGACKSTFYSADAIVLSEADCFRLLTRARSLKLLASLQSYLGLECFLRLGAE